MEALRSKMRPNCQQSKEKSAKETVASANSIVNPFAQLKMTMELPYSCLSEVRLRSKAGPQLSGTEFDWIFRSVSELKDHYQKSIMGWDEADKRKELQHPQQRFLIASHELFGEQIAFLSFRWDVEEGDPIMYVYELGVTKEARRNKLAWALMKYAEDLCKKVSVCRILLTVFIENQAAMTLYRDKLR